MKMIQTFLFETDFYEQIRHKLSYLQKNSKVPSKLLTSTGFSWKIFFYSKILLGEPPWKKSTRHVKSRSLQFQNQNFDSVIHSGGKKDFPRVSKIPSGLLTSTDTKNVWRSCPPKKVYGKFDMNIAQKAKWGYVRSWNYLIFLMITFQGDQLLFFFHLLLLRRNITFKHIFES
jgi:hypothetical protein